MNGTTTVSTDLTMTLPTVLSSTVTGTGTVHMNAAMTWSGGTVNLTGGLEVLAGRTVTFPNNATARVVINSSLTNHGTVVMGQGNALVVQGTVSVVNASDGLWTINDGTLSSNGCGTLTFSNAGTLRKSAGSGALALTGCTAYSNSGTLDIQSGFAFTDSSLTNTGAVSLASGTWLQADRVTFDAGSSFSGSGEIRMNGTTTVSADLTIGVPIIQSGSLTGTGTVRVSNAMTWSSGSLLLSGGLEVQSGGTMTLGSNGQSVVIYPGISVRNFGTVSWVANSGIVYQGGGDSISVRNEASGVWTLNGGPNTLSANGSPTVGNSFGFSNFGLLNGSGTMTVIDPVHFSNSGTVSGVVVNTVP
jgi:hypothetical protein